jgi:hypothetical protein
MSVDSVGDKPVAFDSMSAEAPAVPSGKTRRVMSQDQKDRMAAGRKAAAEAKKRAAPPVVPTDAEATIAALRAEVDRLKPKPVDVSALPEYEIICELGYTGKKDEQDNPIAETLTSPEDPRWDQLAEAKSVFPSLIITKILRDPVTGAEVGRKQVRGFQARNTRIARDAWRTFIRTGSIDELPKEVSK